MNSCLQGNGCLWLLIILLILGTTCGTNLLSSSALTGCGWPILAALLYCTWKNGTLRSIFCGGSGNGNGGCGCGYNA